MKGFTFFSGIFFASLSSFAGAQVSTLINFPNADVLGHREFQFNQVFSSTTPKLNTSYVQSTNYLIGLFDLVELSGNYDWLGGHTYGVKLTPFRSKDEKWALGTGLQNMRGLKGDPFACARYTQGNWNLHAGWLNMSESQFTFGVETAIDSRLTIGLEYGSAPSGTTAACLFYTLCDGLVLQAMASKPNDSTQDVTHSFVMVYTFRF